MIQSALDCSLAQTLDRTLAQTLDLTLDCTPGPGSDSEINFSVQVSLLVQKALKGLGPGYSSDFLVLYETSRSLRSSRRTFRVPESQTTQVGCATPVCPT